MEHWFKRKSKINMLFIIYTIQHASSRVDHKWLSSYDVAATHKPILPALRLLYYAWLSKEEKIVYNDIVQELKEVYNQISYSTFNV